MRGGALFDVLIERYRIGQHPLEMPVAAEIEPPLPVEDERRTFTRLTDHGPLAQRIRPALRLRRLVAAKPLDPKQGELSATARSKERAVQAGRRGLESAISSPGSDEARRPPAAVFRARPVEPGTRARTARIYSR